MSIQQQLIRWGRSRAINDAYHLDYPHETAFSRMSKSDGWAVKMPPLDDDEHGAVDRVVSELRASNEVRHSVIVLAYVEGLMDNTIARLMTKLNQINNPGSPKVKMDEVKSMRLQAEGWIESRIEVDT